MTIRPRTANTRAEKRPAPILAGDKVVPERGKR